MADLAVLLPLATYNASGTGTGLNGYNFRDSHFVIHVDAINVAGANTIDVILQMSDDNDHWDDTAAVTGIDSVGDGAYIAYVDKPTLQYVRTKYTITPGDDIDMKVLLIEVDTDHQ